LRANGSKVKEDIRQSHVVDAKSCTTVFITQGVIHL